MDTTKDTTKSARKSVRLKQQRDGSLRPYWYGQFRIDSKQREINLNIPWRGTPPASGKWSDLGSTRFEASRREAEAALTAHVEEARHKGRAEHLTERLIESKTGRSIEYAIIADLPDLWRNHGGDSKVSNRYLSVCEARFRRFIDFMGKRNRSSPAPHVKNGFRRNGQTAKGPEAGAITAQQAADTPQIPLTQTGATSLLVLFDSLASFQMPVSKLMSQQALCFIKNTG